MTEFLGMIKRNMLVYFRDRMAVVFSILTPVLIFLLYVLFLRQNFVSGLTSQMKGLEDIVGEKDVNSFANLILLAGVIASSLITVSYSSLQTIVSDRENRVDYDISATPVKRIIIILSYMTSGFFTTLFVTWALLSSGLIIVSCISPCYFTFGGILSLFGVTALGALSSTSLFMIFMCLFKTPSQAGAFQGLLCAGSGFIIGAYIPISQFSRPVQTIANMFPGSHIAAVLRKMLLEGVLNHMNSSINGIDDGEFVRGVFNEFSFNLNMFGNSVSDLFLILYPIILIFLSILVFSILYNRVYKRK